MFIASSINICLYRLYPLLYSVPCQLVIIHIHSPRNPGRLHYILFGGELYVPNLTENGQKPRRETKAPFVLPFVERLRGKSV